SAPAADAASAAAVAPAQTSASPESAAPTSATTPESAVQPESAAQPEPAAQPESSAQPEQPPSESPDFSKHCSNNGESMCASDADNKFWSCTDGKWTLMTCSNNDVCGQSSDNKAVCHDPSKPIEKPEQPQKLEPCDNVGDGKCASDGKNKYYTCTDKGWQLLTCDGDTICGQSSDNAVVCHDPNKPLEKPEQPQKLEPCDNVGDGKCASDGKNKYYTCTDKGWQLLTCDGDT
ncbi:hypothetical protein EC988_008910, partial [Linderina pennispora]